MKDKVLKLLDVKSLVTLTLTGTFAYLSIIGKITPTQFMTVFVIVIGFYFGIQATKTGGK